MAQPGDPQEWLGARRAAPFDIVRAAHAELLVTDLRHSREFYVNLLGFVVTEEDDSAIYLRGYEDRHHHCLVLRSGRVAAAGHLSFLVASEAELELAADHYRAAGCFTRWLDAGEERGQGPALRVQDPLGCPLEFFSRMEKVPCLLQRYHLQQGARMQRLDHFNLHVPDVQRAFDLYHELGFGCSEYIGGDGGDSTIYAAWMFRKPHVHDVALTAGRGPRLHHLGFWAADKDAILNTCDALGGAGWQETIERGPGRHGVSNAFYLYLRDPDGHRIELYTADYWTGDPDLDPVRWSVNDEQRRSFWGHTVPERWYLESSLLQAADGSTVPVSDPAAQELRQPLLPR
ncbi:MAG: 3,4-dihydroxyphenylacetate 2,3-dioxygenase [Candidatus Dormibacteraeota bacterium]|nr:3,4-dihydroxyphenylacetate 2,3-dioxygenase [Candidatus Dormibacteraeota bacterium]